jgi:hypothetical protein
MSPIFVFVAVMFEIRLWSKIWSSLNVANEL